jgi:hypothetical protein
MVQNDIAGGLKLILQGIGILQQRFANRRFTIDGRLVGDIGEIIAAAEYDVTLPASRDSRSTASTIEFTTGTGSIS